MYEIKNFIGSLSAITKSRKEKIIVLDVEGYSTVRPYNVGYIIADLHGNIYRKRSFALPPCIWENLTTMLRVGHASEMTMKNVQEILKDCEKPKLKRKYRPVTPETFTRIFTNDVRIFKVKRMFAYNVNFDKGAIQRLIGVEKFASLGLKCCDIISGITTTTLMSKEYLNFCKTNNYFTDKGNYLTKAETVIRYLLDDLTYEEQHTGLEDVLDEYFILLTALSKHKKIDWKPCQAWRLLKNYAIEKGIDAPP